MTLLPPGTEGPAGNGGRASARLLARPGLALALAAPVSLVALCWLPRYAPGDRLALAASLAAALVVVAAAALGGPWGGERRPPADPLSNTAMAPRPSWSDPAALSVERWLARWPGVAGAGAISWWVARLGGAGLLCALAFGAAGLGHGTMPSTLAAVVVVALVLISAASYGRLLTAVALATVAAAGAMVTIGGIVALYRGRLTAALLPPGVSRPPAPAAVVVGSATTVVLLCLLATGLLASGAALPKREGRGPRWAMSAAKGTAVACWALAVPVLVRAGGLSPANITRLGGPRALTAALATVLGPLGGGDAPGMARGAVLVTCLAGAFGAAGAATGVASKVLSALRPPGPGRLSARVATPGHPALAVAAATSLLAAGTALVGAALVGGGARRLGYRGPGSDRPGPALPGPAPTPAAAVAGGRRPHMALAVGGALSGVGRVGLVGAGASP